VSPVLAWARASVQSALLRFLVPCVVALGATLALAVLVPALWILIKHSFRVILFVATWMAITAAIFHFGLDTSLSSLQWGTPPPPLFGRR